MNVGSDWFDDIAKSLNAHRDALGREEARRHKLGMLLRVARRIDEFSADCSECHALQPEVTTLSEALKRAPLTKEKRRKHVKAIQRIVGHLRKKHRLTYEGQHVGLGMSLGAGIGVAIGAGLDNVAIGLPIGVGIGLALGAGMDAKARKEGKVI